MWSFAHIDDAAFGRLAAERLLEVGVAAADGVARQLRRIQLRLQLVPHRLHHTQTNTY